MNPTEQMMDAVKAGNAPVVKQMLASKPELAATRNDAGVSALLVAVYHGQNEIAELLLPQAPSPDIFEAAAVGHAKRIGELLASDSSLRNAYSADGWTPLHLAAFFGREQAALALVEKGANLQALSTNENRNTPLHAAVANHQTNLVRMLLAAGAGVDAKTGAGWTALHTAAFIGDRVIAEILLAHHPDLSAKNDKGQTALDVALEKGHQAIADSLRKPALEKKR
jgi:ankyrin repeat protein